MTIDDEHEKELREIIDGLQCPKNFQCYRSGFENLCKARALETEPPMLICCEKHPQKCTFLNVAGGFTCECPLRVYIAEKLKKKDSQMVS
jgi:hypothetical protein